MATIAFTFILLSLFRDTNTSMLHALNTIFLFAHLILRRSGSKMFELRTLKSRDHNLRFINFGKKVGLTKMKRHEYASGDNFLLNWKF